MCGPAALGLWSENVRIRAEFSTNIRTGKRLTVGGADSVAPSTRVQQANVVLVTDCPAVGDRSRVPTRAVQVAAVEKAIDGRPQTRVGVPV